MLDDPNELNSLRAAAEGMSGNGASLFAGTVAATAAIVGGEAVLMTRSVGPKRLALCAFHRPGGGNHALWLSPGETEWDSEIDASSSNRFRGGGARKAYPNDPMLTSLNADAFLLEPLIGSDGEVLGHLWLFAQTSLAVSEWGRQLLRMLASRAAAELRRERIERTLSENEARLRDLFDEAPIAYVNEGLDTTFIRANRAARRILGITAEEVPTTKGSTFVPDTPEAQRRLHEAFESVGRGTDTSGVVLELRRKDNGKPIWIQWWSKPDASGTYTRTMFVDITERVLMEQRQARLEEQNLYLREEIKSVHNFDEIVGRSAQLVATLRAVTSVAATDSSVLITGETGTGKELIARAIHSASHRREKPLIKLNCAALPTGLVESELFGHEKGAFSGAIARRIGRFELAHGGTIFLDEIGEVPMDVQVKLLRVLQEKEFERVGGAHPIKCDIRVIAATNRDLSRAIAEGRFREDLYYRLNVFPIHVPPLRERREDIAPLVQHFLRKFAARIGKRIDAVSPELGDRLAAYPWPGNVRELENILERAVILSATPIVGVESAPAIGAAAPSTAYSTTQAIAPPSASLEHIERQHILAMLSKSNWVIDGDRGAARLLGLHPNTLRSRMKKLRISRAAGHDRRIEPDG